MQTRSLSDLQRSSQKWNRMENDLHVLKERRLKKKKGEASPHLLVRKLRKRTQNFYPNNLITMHIINYYWAFTTWSQNILEFTRVN